MMEKSTFDKNGIKRHEVASEFRTLISFQSVCGIQTGLSGEDEAGVNLLPMTSIFFTRRTHFQWRSLNTLVTSIVFSCFLTSKSRIRPVYSKNKKHTRSKIHL